MTYIIGIADLKVSRNPSKLVTVGLGSCVGIVLHDPSARVGALIHAMLPSVKYSKSKDNRAKFVDTAVPMAIEEMEKLGARRYRITAKLVGGARMFTEYENGAFIGDRNIQAAKNILKEHGVKIIARNTGGTIGRTVEFDISTGKVLVKTAVEGVKEL
jgi:chemotaxis protein CheD